MTGVPLVGVVAIALADLAGAEVAQPEAAASTLLLGLIALAVGLLASVLAARSVADPVRAVQDAMGRIEEGDLDSRVPVDDASEIGLLEAGFNRMASGLAERERLRDLFGRHVGRDVARAALDGVCASAASCARSRCSSSTLSAPRPSPRAGRRPRWSHS